MIRQLSQSVINKIAAGEVVERPASVVKELMENAVDAGATRIDVSVKAGGADVVRVVDNGCGISEDELELAVASHATSKIASADDLFSVGTLGFRGEALASIAEISRLAIRSRTADSQGGAEVEVVGGKASPVVPCGCPVGTSIEVRNLFFNTPVRRKFLRTTQTEFGHASEAFARIALAMPGIHFTLKHNDRPVFDLPGSSDWLDRIGRVVGRQIAGHLIAVDSVDGPVRLSGHVAHPSQSRSNTRMQYLFLNGRHIRDRALQHALAEAYRGLLTTGRQAIAFLSLELPADMVDVNVHPTKLEVRFTDSGRLYSQLLGTLRTKFLGTDLTTRVEMPDEADPSGAHDEAEADRHRQQVVGWAKGEVASWRTSSGGDRPPAGPLDSSSGKAASRPLELTRLDRSWAPAGPGRAEGPSSAEETNTPGPASTEPASTGPAAKALQLHNRYLVAESEDGVMVIDQHALHERILYEQLRERIMSGPIESQALLVPEPVDLNPTEIAAVIEHQELFQQLGMKLEPFGGDTVLVSAYPAMLANMEPKDVLAGLLDRLLAGGKLPDRGDLLDQLLHTIACKAAVKAGDRLTPDEITSLLDQRHLVNDPHHCPHGRPTALVFSRKELDKQFRRT
jgi:DNA mismatch repair protein MutL